VRVTIRLGALGVLATVLLMSVPSAGAGPVTYVTKDCIHVGIEPHSIVFACADGNFYANHLQWGFWGVRHARGHGVFHQNDCNPSCAQGHFRERRGKIRLRYRRWCPKIHKYVFRHATVRFRRPLLGRSEESFALYCPI
jgi:hypothetical protein